MLQRIHLCEIEKKIRILEESTTGSSNKRTKTLYRVFKINNSWVGFHLDVKKLIFLLGKNCFPSWVIDKSIHRYLSKKMNPSLTGPNASSNSGKTSTHFYKLPYVGRFSKIAKTKLREVIKRYCKLC